MAEVEYTQPNSIIDLERRQAAERGEVEEVGEARSFQVEGNETDAYIGVSPEYQNYADETHKPFSAEEGPEAQTEQVVREALGMEGSAPVQAPEPSRRRREPAPE